MRIKISSNDHGNPPNKLADAELHFEDTDGILAGLKLIGFGIWQRYNGPINVTFPARQYAVNGERRSFALLRPIVDTAAQDRIREFIISAYQAWIEDRDLPREDPAPPPAPVLAPAADAMREAPQAPAGAILLSSLVNVTRRPQPAPQPPPLDF